MWRRGKGKEGRKGGGRRRLAFEGHSDHAHVIDGVCEIETTPIQARAVVDEGQAAQEHVANTG